MADKYALELKRYYLVCHFCGCFLDENVINSVCLKNSNTVKPDERGTFTINTVSQEYLNTKRHFFGTPKMENSHNKNMEINLNQYINNLNNLDVKDPYYFNTNFIPNKNIHNKIIQLEVSENDIFKIFEKFYKHSKKLGFDIEDSLNKCFKDKKNGIVTNEMISFYLNSKYDLEEIENKKLLIYYSDFPEDKNSEFKFEELVLSLNKYLEEKSAKDKKAKSNPFENNIYNLNETHNNFNMNYNNLTASRSKSPPSKNRYTEESFRLGNKIIIFFIHQKINHQMNGFLSCLQSLKSKLLICIGFYLIMILMRMVIYIFNIE